MEATRDSAAGPVDVAPAVEPGRPRALVRAVDAVVERRPVLVSALVAVVVGLGHARWIWNHRQLGAYDADEAGYIANALRFHAGLVDGGPSGLLDALQVNASAPLVPLLSVPLLVVGPQDPRTAILVQPLLLVVATTCIAAITRRRVGPWPTVVAAVAFLTLPTTLHAAESYWFGLGVTAAVAVAVWALFRSDRAANRWIWVFGLALAATVLARTMALGYVPALIGCALVVVGWQRRGLLRLGAALALAVAVGAPWYVDHRDAVFDYLFGYGYGDRAEIFGSSSLLGQLVADPVDVVLDGGVVLPLLVLGVAVPTVAEVVRRRGWRGAAAQAVAPRERRALLVVAAVGLLALVTSANQGGWFTMPLFVALVPLATEVVVRAGPRARHLAAAVVGGFALLLLAASWWILPYRAPVPFPTHYEEPFSEYDARFSPDRRGEHDAAAREWDAANQDVAELLRGLHDDTGAVFTVSGNMLLMNTNTIQLAAELDGWSPRTTVPDTEAPAAERAEWLTPTDFDEDGNPVERVVVVVDDDETVFTPDREAEAFLAQAQAEGWVEIAAREIPSGGTVRVLRHP